MSHVLVFRNQLFSYQSIDDWEIDSYKVMGVLIGRRVDIKHMVYDYVFRPIDILYGITGCEYDDWEVRYHNIINAIMKKYHYNINDIHRMIYDEYLSKVGDEMGI